MIRWLEEQRNPPNSDGRQRTTVMRYSLHITEPEMQRLSQEIIEWAQTTEKVTVQSLWVDFKIYEDSFWDWYKKSPDLRGAWEQAKSIIGEKRERMGLQGKWNAQLVALTMPLYNKEYRAWKLESMAAKEKASGGATINVVMDKMPDSDKVPSRHEGTD